MNAPSLSEKARPLIQLDLDASTFAADWKHCDEIANYLARMASFDRTDTFLYANLFSTVLNELLEIIYCQHRPEGLMHCSLLRDGGMDRIALDIPVGDAERAFYHRSVEDAQSDQAMDLYTRLLLGEAEPDRAVGFLELATDYGAKIWLDPADEENALRLVIDVSFENQNSTGPEIPQS